MNDDIETIRRWAAYIGFPPKARAALDRLEAALARGEAWEREGWGTHERAARLEAELTRLRKVISSASTPIIELRRDNERLREENARLTDRHNRESHGTASHEAMAYDHLKAENDRLREELAAYQKRHNTEREEFAALTRCRAENERLRKENRILCRTMLPPTALDYADSSAARAALGEEA